MIRKWILIIQHMAAQVWDNKTLNGSKYFMGSTTYLFWKKKNFKNKKNQASQSDASFFRFVPQRSDYSQCGSSALPFTLSGKWGHPALSASTAISQTALWSAGSSTLVLCSSLVYSTGTYFFSPKKIGGWGGGACWEQKTGLGGWLLWANDELSSCHLGWKHVSPPSQQPLSLLPLSVTESEPKLGNRIIKQNLTSGQSCRGYH